MKFPSVVINLVKIKSSVFDSQKWRHIAAKTASFQKKYKAELLT